MAIKKKEKQKRMAVMGEERGPSEIAKFRQSWMSKGYELVNITQLCEFKLGCSGWINDFDDPDDEIYHIQVHYRNENIAVMPMSEESVDEKFIEDGYTIFYDKEDANFIIFKLCKVNDGKKERKHHDE